MKRVIRWMWFIVAVLGMTLLMSTAEIVTNGVKMGVNAILNGWQSNTESVTIFNELNWYNLRKTDFWMLFSQAFLILISMTYLQKLWIFIRRKR